MYCLTIHCKTPFYRIFFNSRKFYLHQLSVISQSLVSLSKARLVVYNSFRNGASKLQLVIQNNRRLNQSYYNYQNLYHLSRNSAHTNRSKFRIYSSVKKTVFESMTLRYNYCSFSLTMLPIPILFIQSHTVTIVSHSQLNSKYSPAQCIRLLIITLSCQLSPSYRQFTPSFSTVNPFYLSDCRIFLLSILNKQSPNIPF